VQDIVKRYIELRYRLLPYNYTLAWEVTAKGLPMARPLFMEYEDDVHLADEMSTYMWGPSFLVAPIVKPGVTSKSIYLPKGVWFNYQNDERLKGGRVIVQKVTNEDIPVFVKAGAFVPYAPLAKSTDDYSTQQLEMHYYADKSVTDSKYQLYSDDGKLNNSWKQGKYQLIDFVATNSKGQLKIDIAKSIGVYEGMPHEREITFIIHNVNTAPKQVTVGGRDVESAWDNKRKELKVKVTLDQKQNLRVNY
jgi:oligosaccharide 4-alpha-D-glucosyltransferase